MCECNYTDVNKPTALPVIYTHSQSTVLDNDNEQLCYWIMYLLYYTLIVILECTLSKK